MSTARRDARGAGRIPLRTVALALMILSACEAREPPEPRSAAEDRSAYLAGLSAPLEGAATACQGIQDPSLLGDCRAALAVRLMRDARPAEALSLCEGLAPGLWRNECFFLTAEAAPLHEARAICARAGTLRPHCLGHLFGVALDRLKPLAAEPGREDEVRAGLEPLLGAFPLQTGGARTPRPQRERALLLGLVAWRVERAGTWTEDLCGTLPSSLCLDGYRAALLGRPEWGEVCERGGGLTWIRELGLPDHGPSEGPAAVWRQLCDDLAAGRVEPAHPTLDARGIPWGHKKTALDGAASPRPHRLRPPDPE